jgi:hypothetical protein
MYCSVDCHFTWNFQLYVGTMSILVYLSCMVTERLLMPLIYLWRWPSQFHYLIYWHSERYSYKFNSILIYVLILVLSERRYAVYNSRLIMGLHDTCIYIGRDRGGLWKQNRPPVSLPYTTQSTPLLDKESNARQLQGLAARPRPRPATYGCLTLSSMHQSSLT